MIEQIKDLLNKKENKPVVIAIEGRAGAGKSTLADRLASDFGGEVIRMDHFFLPPDLRGKERINVHYERFLTEVVNPIKVRAPFSYRIFDCALMEYHGEVKIEMKPLLIVEGAYSLWEDWDTIFDLRIFCDIGSDEQRERIIKRNGEEGYGAFRDKWIPLEEDYFARYQVKERCDIIYILQYDYN